MGKGLTVVSLFDGISCGQIALKRAGFEIDKYFACEIKKDAIIVTTENFPNTIQLGDVRDVNFAEVAGGGASGFINRW